MNYRHIYHAGNFADVFKHWVLTLILEKLCQKDTPFCLLDTHSGLGLYDLDQPQAQNTLEFKTGVAKLLQHKVDPIFAPYVNLVKESMEIHKAYPGSAAIMQAFLRAKDRLLLNELHPEDFAVLQQNFVGDRRIKLFNQDAYQCLKALLPPPERRGLILIDPAFEKKDETTQIVQGIEAALKRFATGIYVIWYPIKDRQLITKFYTAMRRLSLPPSISVELHANQNIGTQLTSCGLIVLNPPWKLVENLTGNLPKLLQYLDFSHGTYNILELAPLES